MQPPRNKVAKRVSDGPTERGSFLLEVKIDVKATNIRCMGVKPLEPLFTTSFKARPEGAVDDFHVRGPRRA